jgi:hypothetical protein
MIASVSLIHKKKQQQGNKTKFPNLMLANGGRKVKIIYKRQLNVYHIM